MRRHKHIQRSKYRTMKRLIIRAIGPLKDVDIALGRFNVIIGLQSSGKSCVLRIASYCAWVEKQIQQSQSPTMFEMGSAFMDILCRYHKMTEYIHEDSYIRYETDTMWFEYKHRTKTFAFCWKDKGHFEYRLPKISYIPSERNIVSLLSNWKSEVTTYDCVLDFMKEWDRARKVIGKTKEIFNLRMNYAYDKSIEDDLIQLQNGKNIHLTNASSGVQSLVPLVVLIGYITRHIYMQDAADVLNRTEAKREKMDRLVDLLYANIKQSSLESILPDSKEDHIVRHSGREYRFRNEVAAQKFSRLVNNYLNYQQTDIYLEEPENNLFPSTQCQLVDWLDAKTNQRIHPISVFLTTHSPYVLRYMMDKSLRGKRFFFTYEYPKEEGVYKVKSLSLAEIEQIIANGVDMFYNYESYIS